MDKLNGKTMDLVGDNIAKLKELFPEAFAEGKIDFDMLRSSLGDAVDKDNERYSFTWHGKQDAIKMALKQSTGTLLPKKEESKDWDTTENLFIEGDNLEVLRVLQNSYRGKIKMCYIDPPYNTGHDFVYEDDFKDNIKNYKERVGETMKANPETGGRYHTNWLNMMYPRLRLAKNLLAEDGVMFISIDDNELTNLRKICDEVLGEDNFVGVLSIENNPKGRKNSDFISVSSEYLLIFAKNKQLSYFIENVPKNANDMTEDEDGNYVHNSGKRVLVGENNFNSKVININSDKNYSVYYRENDKSLKILKEEFGVLDPKLIAENYVKYSSYNNGCLVENTYTENKFRELFEKEALEFSKDKIYEKNFNDTIRIKSQLVNREYEAIVKGRKQKFSIELTTTGAGTYLKNLFQLNEVPFTAPKNVGYLKLLITLFEKEPFIVLDFFAGSATVADAVMQLNAEDGGNRKFIMVQIPEQTPEESEARKAGYQTISDIGKERIRRAGEKIKADNKDKDEIDKLDIGFKVFALDETNLVEWDENTKDAKQTLLDYTADSIKTGRAQEDVLYEVLLKYGIDLTLPIEERMVAGKKVYSLAGNYLMICLEKDLSLDVIKEIASLKPQRVVFYDTGFADDSVKANAEQTLKKQGVTDIRVI